ncbi:type IV secretory system conjugative DNA transfer family protein [Ferruginibacter sp.]|nr:type IV secretory system conjugative DNA transfer family protein [Ferruginibacter sp.]
MIQLLSTLFSIIFSVFEAIISGVADLVVAASSSKRNQNYNADFINPDKVLLENAKGFCLTGNKCLSVKDSFSNALCFGGSGSGKSSRVLIPSILKMTGVSSLCIHDPSGELFEKTSGAMKHCGYNIKVLNYANADHSENFNPLYRVHSISDCKRISKLLIQTSLGGGGKTDPFWNASAESLLSIFIRYVLFHTEEQHHTLYNVLCLINTFSGSPQKVDRLFVQAKDDDLLSDYKAFVAYDSKMLMSIVATVRTALSIFSDPGVARVTSTDTIDFESFRNEKTILYINNNVNDMKYYSVLSSIFFEQFFASVMSKLPKQGDLPIFFLLDEASSLYLSILPIAISNIRKYDAGILQIYQSQSQLFDLYGIPQGRNIVANSFSKVYMSGQPLETARELELILGKYEYMDDDNNRRTRQLLTMDEIRILSESIILVGNLPPIKAKMIPYYEQKELNRLSQLSPYTVEQKYYEDELEQINMNPDGKTE